MGYCITVTDNQLKIKQENFQKCLEAIKSLHGQETNNYQNKSHFSWVDEKFYQLNSLDQILNEWRWKPLYDENGNIQQLEFNGEKLGDDEILFKTLAPFIEPDSFINFRGEDNEHWQYAFNGKTIRELKGEVIFQNYSMFKVG